MPRRSLLSAILGVSCVVASAHADEPRVVNLAAETSGLVGPAEGPPAETVEAAPPVCHEKRTLGQKIGRFIFPPVVEPPRSAKAFVVEGWRYEPRVRDARFLPADRLLPGTVPPAVPDMLPVIPPREHGYFVVPVSRGPGRG